MSLVFHLFLHALTALIAGWLGWVFFGYPIYSFTGAIFGGVLIDLDHLVDYFLAFGGRFRVPYFLRGYQFLKSDKIYILFHGWEYGILLAIALSIVGGGSASWVFLFTLGLGGLFHLVVDTHVNHGMSLKAYSLFYRLAKGFDVVKIVTREHYQIHLDEKRAVSFSEEKQN